MKSSSFWQTISQIFQCVFSLLRQQEKRSRTGLYLGLGLLAISHTTVVNAQSNSATPPNVSATIAAMYLLFPTDEEQDATSNVTLPKKIALFGLDDESKKNDLEKQLVELVEIRDESALVEIITQYSLTLNMEMSNESTLALRSTTLGNLDEKFAISVQNKDIEAVRTMLKQNSVDVNKAVKISDTGFVAFTPITRAASIQDIKMIELLLSHGADPDITGEKNILPPLAHAVSRQNLEMAKILLDAGATVDIDPKEIGREPLAVWAAQTDDLTLIKLLIEEGVDSSQVGAYGWTPLSQALLLGHSTMAEFLVDSNDPRILIDKANPASLHDRFDSRYFPQTNALHLARHFLDPESRERLLPLIVNRARELGGETAVLLMELQARRSASQLAYANLDTLEAVEQRKLGLSNVDVLSFDFSSNGALVNASMSMLVNLHELSVIAGVPFSQENREKAAHIGEMDDKFIKWHDMLDVMTVASEQDASPQIVEWRKKHGDPPETGWSYDLLLSWADEEISDRADRVRVYETIDEFRSVNVFTND